MTEVEYESFTKQILSKNGLDAEVLVRFQGRKLSGSIVVTFETDEIIDNISVALKGSKVAAAIDLKAKLSNSITRKSINFQVEDPSLDQNGLFEKIKNKIIEDISSEIISSDLNKKKIEKEGKKKKI